MHPTAVLIGDVIVGPRCYVGPAACLRGDFGRIILHEGVNVQDTCVMHGFPESDTVIEADGHIGHGSVVHGAHIGRNVLIGMNAVVMDRARIGESLDRRRDGVRARGHRSCRRASLALGIPATRGSAAERSRDGLEEGRHEAVPGARGAQPGRPSARSSR